jgi:hypothetical protein
MRTVTFSDPRVIEQLNRHFVLTWYNYQPGFHSCEGSEELKIVDAAPHIFGTRNWYTLFLTPKTEVLHAIPGYWEPERFLQQVEFVAELWTAVSESSVPAREFEAVHRARDAWVDGQIRETERLRTSLPALGLSGKFGLSLEGAAHRKDFTSEKLKVECDRRLAHHRHDFVCMNSALEGLRTLRQIHRNRADRGLERLTIHVLLALPSSTAFMDFTSTKVFKPAPNLEKELAR